MKKILVILGGGRPKGTHGSSYMPSRKVPRMPVIRWKLFL